MYNINQVISFINGYSDYDIRVSKNARFVDQKCTPDFVCLIADCILSTSCANKDFTVLDLWKEEYFCDSIVSIYSKPNPNSVDEKNEINKVLSQPLKLLAYAHALREDRITGKTLVFHVENMDLLEFIAASERNSYNFLYEYFKKVMTDSGLVRIFDIYRSSCEQSRNLNDAKIAKLARRNIYESYYKFIKANTLSKSETDIRRMFHKVFNVFAFKNGLPGSKDKILLWHELMYNRENWRDINKDKNQSRSEVKENISSIHNRYFIEYHVKKAMNLVRKYHNGKSEVNDQYSNATATEAHHIFPRSARPALASYLENLIMLTPTQHTVCAHPNGNTTIVDSTYQYTCLMSKSESIQKSIACGDDFYDINRFVDVINIGYDSEVVDKGSQLTIQKIQKSLTIFFSSSEFSSFAADENSIYY